MLYHDVEILCLEKHSSHPDSVNQWYTNMFTYIYNLTTMSQYNTFPIYVEGVPYVTSLQGYFINSQTFVHFEKAWAASQTSNFDFDKMSP